MASIYNRNLANDLDECCGKNVAAPLAILCSILGFSIASSRTLVAGQSPPMIHCVSLKSATCSPRSVMSKRQH